MEYQNISKRTLAGVIVGAVIIFIAGQIYVAVRTNREAKDAAKHAAFSTGFNIGNVRATAYLVPTAVATKKVTIPCLNAPAQVDVGNFDVVVVRKYWKLPIYSVYKFTLGDFTFVKPPQDTAWNEQLVTLHLPLTGTNADQITINQYEDCYFTNEFMLGLFGGQLKMFKFNPLKSKLTTSVVMVNGGKFSSVAKDKINSVILSADKKQPFYLVHWQYNPKTYTFSETGKDLSNTPK